MPKNECRESRPVPFSPSAIVWAAAADGVLTSLDVDGQGRLSPDKPVGMPPFQRQSPAGSLQRTWGVVAPPVAPVAPVAPVPREPPEPPEPPGPSRVPLRSLAGNDVVIRVLGGELQALEEKNLKLATQVRVQNQLIRGFCAQELQRKQGP